MAKKKAKKKNTRQPQLKQLAVRLSQCMIVKNEEKNIVKALSWAKGAAFEQIVVDTGSTDRTVELAEKMGAKVYHFEWINDFSAAKNFAMDQATGNWIAILDADEYMPKEDVKELMALLKKVQSNPKLLKEYDSVNCSWVQLDDEGKAYTVLTVQRIFQNRPDLRYRGKIHEAVMIRNKHLGAENLRIMHTGYAMSVFNEADKRERNIKLLRSELERDPEDPHIMLYLADSIKADGTEESRAYAEQLYMQALESKRPADPAIKRLAYDFLIPRFLADREKREKAMSLCASAIAELPDHIDYYYFRAVLNNIGSRYKEAMDDLQKCEKAFSSGKGAPETRVLMPSPVLLFYQMIVSAQGLNDKQEASRNTTILNSILSEGKAQPAVLGSLMADMFKQGKTGIEVFERIAQVYDLADPQDLLLIANAAKESGILLFAQKVMEMANASNRSKR